MRIELSKWAVPCDTHRARSVVAVAALAAMLSWTCSDVYASPSTIDANAASFEAGTSVTSAVPGVMLTFRTDSRIRFQPCPTYGEAGYGEPAVCGINTFGSSFGYPFETPETSQEFYPLILDFERPIRYLHIGAVSSAGSNLYVYTPLAANADSGLPTGDYETFGFGKTGSIRLLSGAVMYTYSSDLAFEVPRSQVLIGSASAIYVHRIIARVDEPNFTLLLGALAILAGLIRRHSLLLGTRSVMER